MVMRVKTNAPAIFALGRSKEVNRKLEDSFGKLSSGKRILRSAHDPSGLAIATTIKSEINSNTRAIRNTNDGISFVQTAEGYLASLSGFAQRIKELSIQAASDTMHDTQRAMIQHEFQAIKDETQRVLNQANYNSKKFFDGKGEVVDIQVGIRDKQNVDIVSIDKNQLKVSLEDMELKDVQLTTKAAAQEAINKAEVMIENVARNRGYLGSLQNRFQTSVKNLDHGNLNKKMTRSRIYDADMAQAASENIKLKTLGESNTITLAAAKAQYKGVMKLVS